MDREKLFKDAQDIIIKCDNDRVEEVAKLALSEGIEPLEMINEGFRVGITKMGDLFERGEVFLPELIQSAEVMKKATDILMESLPKGIDTKRGTVVIGTVQGDIHDIGKILVVTMLQANSFEVFDLGHDVETEMFIEKAKETNADIIGTSSLLTTTMKYQKELEDELKKSGLKGKFKTIVGGAPVTQRWADRIGADAYAENASTAVREVQSLMGS
ncbi:MAG: corrinoid protein [Spirochaetota bacterium]|nr:MAG: corrinoid protein [Spirochaetota bacterium]